MAERGARAGLRQHELVAERDDRDAGARGGPGHERLVVRHDDVGADAVEPGGRPADDLGAPPRQVEVRPGRGEVADAVAPEHLPERRDPVDRAVRDPGEPVGGRGVGREPDPVAPGPERLGDGGGPRRVATAVAAEGVDDEGQGGAGAVGRSAYRTGPGAFPAPPQGTPPPGPPRPRRAGGAARAAGPCPARGPSRRRRDRPR